jgi:hypothetical protein
MRKGASMKSRTLAFLATAVVSALIGAIIAMSLDRTHASSRKTLRAEQFELIDSKGKTRGLLTSSGPNEGHTLLRLDGKDQTSLMLLVNPDSEGGSQISFFNSKGERVLNLQESRPLSQTQRPTTRGIESSGQKGSAMVDKGGNVDVWDEIVRLSHEIDELKKRIR